jgi:hypothetical protein
MSQPQSKSQTKGIPKIISPPTINGNIGPAAIPAAVPVNTLQNGAIMNRDSIKDNVGKPETNPYRYADGNPINFSDPNGLIAWVNPITYWQGFFGGAGDLYRNYKDMRDANTIGADKYFHCMGHCEAARRGDGGRDVSELIGEGREQFDEKVKGDSRSDCDTDRAANNQGRSGDPNKPCKQICKSLRPGGLNPRY